MAAQKWRGSFAIPMTPFDEKDRIDVDVLAREIEFCIECHVGGIVVPVMVSEFFVLTEEERRLMIRVPLEVARGRVPIIANCAAVSTALAVSYAEYAQKLGAAGVIAMPPYMGNPDFGRIYEYYKAINDAVTIPIWIQNAGVSPLSPDQVIKLCTELEHVSWVKEEVVPSTHAISALVSRQCPYIEGVMGGSGGRYLIAEWERGAVGNVHACEFCDVIQRIYDLLFAGQEDDARTLFEHILPGIVLEGLMGMAFAKEIMVRRGVFKNHRMRSQSKPLDASDMREIDKTWERIQPYLLWHA